MKLALYIVTLFATGLLTVFFGFIVLWDLHSLLTLPINLILSDYLRFLFLFGLFSFAVFLLSFQLRHLALVTKQTGA